MNTCETCVHWRKWETNANYKANIGECKMVVLWWDASEWVDDDNENGCTRIISPKYDNQRAFVQDGSDYKASLFTRNDFGCVSHKEKE